MTKAQTAKHSESVVLPAEARPGEADAPLRSLAKALARQAARELHADAMARAAPARDDTDG